MSLDLAKVSFQLVHTPDEAAAVNLELGFARAASSDPAPLLGEGSAARPQPWKAVPKLRQLDLCLSFLTACILGENVEDHGGSIQGRATQDLLQVELLGRRELIVEDNGVCIDRVSDRLDFLRFATADIGGWIRRVSALMNPFERISACRVDQKRELVEGGVGLERIATTGRDPNEDNPLPEGPLDETSGLAAKVTKGATVAFFVSAKLGNGVVLAAQRDVISEDRGSSRSSPATKSASVHLQIGDLEVGHMGRRPGQCHRLADIDQRLAARHPHDDLASDESPSMKDRRRDRGTRATRIRDTSTAFPHTVSEFVGAAHGDEMNIRSIGKVPFHGRSGHGQINGVRIIDLTDDMRVADVARLPSLHGENGRTRRFHEIGHVWRRGPDAPLPYRRLR